MPANSRARWIALGVEGEAQLRAAFRSDDLEAIRGRIRDARTDPEAQAKLEDEFLGNLMRSLPSIRRAEDAKIRALKDALGAEGYERFRMISVREDDVDEFDALCAERFGGADPAAERTK